RAAEVPRIVGDGDLSANVIQVRVAHLGLDRTTNTPVVILQEQEGERVLPIWIGPAEASAIAMELAGVKFARPLTHDLLKQAILKISGSSLRSLALLALLSGAGAAGLVAQGIVVSGRVLYGPGGRPLARTRVVLHEVSMGGDGRPIDSTSTDAQGRYTLTIRRP